MYVCLLAGRLIFECTVEPRPPRPHHFRRPLSFTQDGEIGVIGTGGCSLDVSRMEKSSHTEDILLSPAPYEHWTIMECLQQPEAIARALAFGGTGCGKTEKSERKRKTKYTDLFDFAVVFLCSHAVMHVHSRAFNSISRVVPFFRAHC